MSERSLDRPALSAGRPISQKVLFVSKVGTHNLRIQGRMQFFEKMSQKALNRVLTLDCSGGGDLLQSPLKIMDLQNKNISVVTKH